jgi:uncharacterized protein
MGYREIDLKLPADYSQEELKHAIGKSLGIKSFSFQLINKSLDARNKRNIFWLLRAGVSSGEMKQGQTPERETISIPYRKRNKKVVITGSGPAGFFSAFLLQQAGFDTLIIERGPSVEKRADQIKYFEKTGLFPARGNYPFGEGGAGTFSDGKLTSRTKCISLERDFVIQNYINAGAPEEIAFLAHPHVGTDKLRLVVKNLRDQYQDLGGEIMFETTVEDMVVMDGSVRAIVTDHGLIKGDIFIFATGNSAYDTYRMLMRQGVIFRTKRFAVGTRVEHPQVLINKAQWGVEKLHGVKAAEYRLTSQAAGKGQVYTFCMCPGGYIVPSMAYEYTLVVNGMSFFARNNKFANAACVAAIDPLQLGAHTPLDALSRVEEIERLFYNFSGGYQAPFCSIDNFINKKEPASIPPSSYPLGLKPAPLWELLPKVVVEPLAEGLKEFSRKIRGFETGNMIGFESKTSSPVQVVRNPSGLCEGFDNLFMVGEGSGYAGGIISSASDGVKKAFDICI